MLYFHRRNLQRKHYFYYWLCLILFHEFSLPRSHVTRVAHLYPMPTQVATQVVCKLLLNPVGVRETWFKSFLKLREPCKLIWYADLHVLAYLTWQVSALLLVTVIHVALVCLFLFVFVCLFSFIGKFLLHYHHLCLGTQNGRISKWLTFHLRLPKLSQDPIVCGSKKNRC